MKTLYDRIAELMSHPNLAYCKGLLNHHKKNGAISDLEWGELWSLACEGRQKDEIEWALNKDTEDWR